MKVGSSIPVSPDSVSWSVLGQDAGPQNCSWRLNQRWMTDVWWKKFYPWIGGGDASCRFIHSTCVQQSLLQEIKIFNLILVFFACLIFGSKPPWTSVTSGCALTQQEIIYNLGRVVVFCLISTSWLEKQGAHLLEAASQPRPKNLYLPNNQRL